MHRIRCGGQGINRGIKTRGSLSNPFTARLVTTEPVVDTIYYALGADAGEDIMATTQPVEVPNVALNWDLNPHARDNDYIETLAEDMRANGFNAKYPVQVYHVGDERNPAQLLGDGHHRVEAARLAKVKPLGVITRGDLATHRVALAMGNYNQNGVAQPMTVKSKVRALEVALAVPSVFEKTDDALAKTFQVPASMVAESRQKIGAQVLHHTNPLNIPEDWVRSIEDTILGDRYQAADGSLVDVEPTALNVTASQRREARRGSYPVTKSADHLRSMVDTALNNVAVVDFDNVVNDQMGSVTGVSADDARHVMGVLGHTLSVNTEDYAGLTPAQQAIWRGLSHVFLRQCSVFVSTINNTAFEADEV